ncbi:hypothetical protein J3R82DRAFT_3563 [Butyriboletus roseoflavus]|nr:hypothetical protein J3R82DRAFT_3563 [Butyriboletus roseoflavus]
MLGLGFEGMSGSLSMSSDQGHTFPQQANYMGFGTLQHACMHNSPQIQTLWKRCLVLEWQLLQRTIECDTIQALFDKLTEVIREGKAPEANVHVGYQNNEKIRFWTHTSFNAYVNSAEDLAKKESTVLVTFLEDENGVIHTRVVIKSLQKDLKTVFQDLVIKGVAPKSWGKASASAKNIVRDYMEHNWSSFWLAENGWKLEHLASLNYPG